MKIEGKQFNYQEFISWVEDLVSQGKTSGPNQSDILIQFTALNLKRMQRLNKTIKLTEEIISKVNSITQKQNWLVITEAWCGDSAQNLPVIGKIASLNSNINLNIILRDENIPWIEKYNTNGSHSVPKLIMFDDAGIEISIWGPRPMESQVIYDQWKNDPNKVPFDQFEKILHTWYAKNKTIAIQSELLGILS